MAVLNGTKLLIFVDGTQVGSLMDNSITINTDLPDATSKDSGGWAEHITGLKDWSGSGSQLYDPLNADTTADDIIAKIIAGTQVVIVFGTNVTGDTYYYGNAHFQNLSINAPMEAAANADFSFVGTGPLASGVTPSS